MHVNQTHFGALKKESRTARALKQLKLLVPLSGRLGCQFQTRWAIVARHVELNQLSHFVSIKKCNLNRGQTGRDLPVNRVLRRILHLQRGPSAHLWL
jgi:hypothetical protein